MVKNLILLQKNLWDLFHDKELSKKVFIEGYKLINLQKISDEEIKKKKWAGTMAFFMKHIYERNLLKRWEEIADRLPEFGKLEVGRDYIKILLSYSLPKMEKNGKIELEKLLDTSLGEKGEELMVSIAQQWFNDGEAQGIEKAAINMLKQNLDTNLISKVTGLSTLQIQKLKSKKYKDINSKN